MGNCVRSSRDDDGVINVFGGGGPREVNLTAKDGRVHRCIKIGKRLFITLTKEKQVALIAIPERELRLLHNVEELSVMEPGTQRLFVNDEGLLLEVLVRNNSIAGVEDLCK